MAKTKTDKPTSEAPLRPVFIHYENAHPDEAALRPFHHAFLVVGYPGAAQELQKETKVVVFDRFGAKTEPDCEMAPPETWEYGKLQKGWTTLQGFTKATDDAIQAAGNSYHYFHRIDQYYTD